jgi:hypothetical protein
MKLTGHFPLWLLRVVTCASGTWYTINTHNLSIIHGPWTAAARCKFKFFGHGISFGVVQTDVSWRSLVFTSNIHAFPAAGLDLTCVTQLREPDKHLK